MLLIGKSTGSIPWRLGREPRDLKCRSCKHKARVCWVCSPAPHIPLAPLHRAPQNKSTHKCHAITLSRAVASGLVCQWAGPHQIWQTFTSYWQYEADMAKFLVLWLKEEIAFCGNIGGRSPLSISILLQQAEVGKRTHQSVLPSLAVCTVVMA